MFDPRWIRRLAAAVLVVMAAFVVVPFPAVADDSGDDRAQAGATSSDGLLDSVVQWLSGLVNGSEDEPTGGEQGPGIDPLG